MLVGKAVTFVEALCHPFTFSSFSILIVLAGGQVGFAPASLLDKKRPSQFWCPAKTTLGLSMFLLAIAIEE